ncbi:hypothetical protein GN157_12340 [Flavobacterium rakeshii]|uniref:DUF4097 family beta strand repeat protein n=1 Tax=Flavobacterium rakeshii TaxID=1038845 RepID=A0A6N8HFK3_9FLAO|nr:hypothetical protein [Flavobacterium rakeshii]MUV04499.1 hypothetical protein [Flavobacterium rakeshii]
MKTLPLKLLVFLLLIPFGLNAGQVKGKYTKEKKIQKVYLVNPDAGLEVGNQYGNIYVTTWNESKTSIDVVIKVSGNNEDQVNKRINGIDVRLNATKGLVACKTDISSSNSRTNIEINYTIKIPKNGSIVLHNQYGNIVLGDIKGHSELKCEYGNIQASQLNNVIAKLEYCNGSDIGYIYDGEIKAEYSNLTIEKAYKAFIKSSYSNINIKEVDKIIFDSEYGDIKITDAGFVSGNSNYIGIKLGTISEALTIKANYGNIDIKEIKQSTNSVSVMCTYTNININFNENYAYNFEFDLQYGSLRGSNNLNFTEKNIRNTSANYKGYYKKNGANKVYITSQYGNINLGRN